MIFISQSGLLDRTLDDDWDGWYLERLRAMVTAPGISSAQRFTTETPGSPPSLASYSIASPAVFEDSLYLSVRGFRECQPLIDRRYYRRNLFAGLDETPDVAENECLLVTDREVPGGAIDGIEFEWLACVGIDRSTPYRGIAVRPALAPPLDAAVIVYRPVAPRVTRSS